MVRKSQYLICFILFLVLCSCTTVPSEPLSATNINTPVQTKPSQTSKPRPLVYATEEPIPSPTVKLPPIEVSRSELRGSHVQFWHPWTNNIAKEIERLGEQFNSENPYGISVEITSQGNNLYRSILNGLNKGEIPNITAAPDFQINSWDNHININQDLDQYIYNPTWGLKTAEINDISLFISDRGSNPSKRNSLPGFATSNLIIYNTTWAKELGFDEPPTTPSDFKEQACAASAASYSSDNDAGAGGWIADMVPTSLLGWISAFNGVIVEEDDSGYEFDSPEVDETFDFLKSVFISGCAVAPIDQYLENEFAERKGLFYSTNITSLPFISSSFGVSDQEDEWIAIPYPSNEGDPFIPLSPYSFSILRSTAEEELASWLFIKWLIEPENQADIVKVSGFIPTRASAFDYLIQYAENNPQWAAVRKYISVGVSEPESGSWNIVRWILSDAARAMISSDFPREEIPFLVNELHTVANEVHLQSP